MILTAHPSPQPKRHPYRFSRLCTDNFRVSLYFTMGRPFSPKNFPLPIGGSGPPSNTWFPGPTQVLNPNGSWIGAAVFAGLTSVTDRPTDRPTDHATRSVTIGRIYVHSTVMRPKNNGRSVKFWSRRQKQKQIRTRDYIYRVRGHPGLMCIMKIRKTSGYATMVHGRGCNPHRCMTTFANVEITSL